MKKIRQIFALLVLLIISVTLVAVDTGSIAGRVHSAENHEQISEAAVFIDKLQLGTYTNKNGSYILKNVPVGTHKLYVSFMGYEQKFVEVEVKKNLTATINFDLEMSAIEMTAFTVTENRAVKRETPIAFSNISQKEIADKYTTEDMPELLDDVPGLFSNSSGLGEAEITMRGFTADKVQILVNGIPVNDPESQVVYWSNWSGLSSNVKSVQVQRGAGVSLYGSGSIGGSVNIETIGGTSNKGFTLRTSSGYYTTKGKVASGKAKIIQITDPETGVITEKKVADMIDYDPINYTTMLKYDSGDLFDGKLNFSANVERKAGDSYIIGTSYDGWSFGLETESKFESHKLNTSLIVAPQQHNQARSNSDPGLHKQLGREYNPTNHKWQENFYNKPQFSIRDKWNIDDSKLLNTNLFITQGKGAGSYLANGKFDVETGEVAYAGLKTSTSTEARYWGKHAKYMYDEYGFVLDGYNPDNKYYTYADGDSVRIPAGANMTADTNHSWKSESHSEHFQVGLNSNFQYEFSDQLRFVFGGEFRNWSGDHFKEVLNFRHFDETKEDSLGIYSEAQRVYDYTTTVINLSTFARVKIDLFDKLNIMLDGQYASYSSEVKENPIKVFDYNKGKFTDYSFYATKGDSIIFPNGDKYGIKDSDYERTYNFFSPKAGINYNLTKELNLFVNSSITYKEPKVSDWYDRTNGPGYKQIYNNKMIDLDPEKAETFEVGFGFTHENFGLDVNIYETKYTDKIESSSYLDDGGNMKTAVVNAGNATHKGIEASAKYSIFNFDTKLSGSHSHNKWNTMNFEKIFYEDAVNVIGKTVPYSPELTLNTDIGYTFYDMPFDGKLRIGFSTRWWDRYFTTFDNLVINQEYWYDEDGNFQTDGEKDPDTDEYVYNSSKLPAFFQLDSSISYKYTMFGKDASLKLNLNNITNKDDNYSKAYISKLYGRSLDGKLINPEKESEYTYFPYVSPSPLFHVFLTMEVKF